MKLGLGTAIAFVIFRTALTSSSAAAVTENFSYVTGAFLDNANGGTGWNGSWNDDTFNSDGAPETIASPGLTYPALNSSGNRLVVDGDASADSRLLATGSIMGATGTTSWIGFLIRKDAKGNGGMRNPDYAGIDLFGSAGATGTDLYAGAFTSGKFGLSGDGIAVESASALTLGATYFLAVKITFRAGTDLVQLFVNPTLGPNEPSNPVASKTDVDFGTIDLFGIESGFNSVWSFDEIRISNAFVDIPEPNAAALLVSGLFSFGRWNRRRITPDRQQAIPAG